MRYINYRTGDGTIIYHGGQNAEGMHVDLATAQKRLKAYLRSQWKKSADTKDNTSTISEPEWYKRFFKGDRT